MRVHVAAAAEKIAAGDIDGGLSHFLDAIEGEGAWLRLPAAAKQELRDNACTLLGQVNEQRQPYSRGDAESIRVPTLFIGGQERRDATQDSACSRLRMCRARAPR